MLDKVEAGEAPGGGGSDGAAAATSAEAVDTEKEATLKRQLRDMRQKLREHKAKLRVRGNEYPCEMVSGWGGLVGKGMATKTDKTGRPTMSVL